MASESAGMKTVKSLYASWDPAARSAEGWLSHFAENSVWCNVPLGDKHEGMSGQLQNYENWLKGAGDGHVEIDTLLEGPGFVCAQIFGCDEITGVRLPSCDVHVINNQAKIVSTKRYWDQATFDRQLAGKSA